MGDGERIARGLGDTIVAVSSARGAAPRGLVRLSGPHAVPLVAARFRPARGQRRLERVRWGATDGRLALDDTPITTPARIFVMRAPRSFTGEDTVEIQVPGSPVLLDLVVDAVRRAGARPADPGEFTRRAFLNGRLDLTQAEGVAAVIHARSEDERKAALTVLAGGASAGLRDIAERLIALLMPVELSIDFSDQDVEIIAADDVTGRLDELRSAIERRLVESGSATRAGDRARVLLVGPANAGKSSLFNALVGEPRALVSDVRGTTRDFLEADVRLNGRDVTLVDTAGLDFVGTEVDRAAHAVREHEVARADLVLVVRDGRDPAPHPEEPQRLLARTHGDLVPMASRGGGGLWTSATTGEGLAALGEAIAAAVDARAGCSALQALQARQRDGLGRALEALERARAALADGSGVELVAADLREALGALRELTGEDYSEEVLDRIMRDFCIGK